MIIYPVLRLNICRVLRKENLSAIAGGTFVKRIYFTTSVVSWFSLIIFRMALSVEPMASTVSSGSASKHSTSECSTSREPEPSDISECLVFVTNVRFSERESTRKVQTFRRPNLETWKLYGLSNFRIRFGVSNPAS
mgnify:CR=1 FL=1|jgi:hypothetical protein